MSGDRLRSAVLISALKPIGGPGSVGFFILCVVLALAIRFFGKAGRRLSRVWLITLVVGYLVLSLPITANYLADRLTSYRPLADLSQLQGVDTLVVLDGDNRRGRVREAKRVFDSAQPRRVIVSGNTWLVDAVIEAGIPADRVAHESRARNTWEQIEALRGLAARRRSLSSPLSCRCPALP